MQICATFSDCGWIGFGGEESANQANGREWGKGGFALGGWDSRVECPRKGAESEHWILGAWEWRVRRPRATWWQDGVGAVWGVDLGLEWGDGGIELR